MDKEYTEMEQVLQRTVEKQSQRISNLMLDLDLAHSQIEVMKGQQEAAEGNKESKKGEKSAEK